MELNSLSTMSSNVTGPAASNANVAQEAAAVGDEPRQPPRPERRGTDIIARFQAWWQNDGDLDDLERHLQQRLATTNDPAARRLLHAYSSFKSQPSGDLFNFLLAFRTARPDSTLSNYERLGLERSLPFTSCINELRRTLQQSDPPRLQIWQAKSISKTSTERQLIWQIQCLNWCHT
jgi:hypothetical protein